MAARAVRALSPSAPPIPTQGAVYKNALGIFKDPHTIECVNKKGQRTDIRARRVVIAVGGRPRALDIPGGELAISSDDIFS